ncbi:MAG: hypothetical protein QOI89_37 [Solirubrobacteraceae bacterium]|nr:hypothetical protein [Solirubrobacteraceae bacterium]
MSVEALRLLLALLGAGFQIASFTWALVDASRARGREFGEYGLPRRVWNWLAFWLGPPPEVRSVSASVSGGVRMTGSVTAVKSPESDVERLGRELAQLRTAFERHQQNVDERLASVQGDVDRLSEDVSGRIAEIEDRERDRRRGFLRREQRAAQLFIVGLLLTTSTYTF